MPKITVHGGPSNVAADEGSGVVVQEPIPVAAEEPAEAETDDEGVDYDSWTVAQLQEELGARELTKTGNKPELVERLQQADLDAADADEDQE